MTSSPDMQNGDGIRAIEVEGARKVYPKGPFLAAKTAVADVSISVERGTVHGLLGPNGAGKTTTLKMLLGLVRPTAGVFRVLGEDPRRPSGRRRVGFMPEQPYFAPHLTATQTLTLYGRLLGLDRRSVRDRISGLLGMVGLEGCGRQELSTFSRGMLQRLGIAQTLIASPDVVVLDEPASGLDPIGQRDVRNLMLDLRSQGVTVMLSSHQLSEVESVCDRVTILCGGLVAAEGRIDALLNVAGRTSVRVRGFAAGLPPAVKRFAGDVALAGSTWVFDVADAELRAVVDAIDDAGGSLEAAVPKRSSLEDYFARLIAGDGGERS
ncbi:MAG: ABC transporter ATP-binding protein [Anaerosomatales bacterium]|nr:ABC transporter ATP-binding protein [Anaerosomatales bacterium]